MSPDDVTPRPPTTPTTSTSPTPAGACDCHMHVFDDRFTFAAGAAIRPAPATVGDYRLVQAALGTERAVVIQPSGYGFDNACTLDAMAQLGDTARGVVVIPPDTPERKLHRLHVLGVRGVRFMMAVPGGLDWPSLPAVDSAVKGFGWHLNLQFDGRQWPDRAAFIASLAADVVIDHFGSFFGPVTENDPGFLAMLRALESGRVWIKLSAPYAYGMSRSGGPDYEDVAVLARLLTRRYPERCLWASNWPHPTETHPPHTSVLMDLLEDWTEGRAATRRRILVENPARLYGFRCVASEAD